MGIPLNATVEDCRDHRRRHHRVTLLNRVEIEIEKYKASLVQEEDMSLWKNEDGRYKKIFSTRETWKMIREKYQFCDWYKAVWFKYATPKFSFILWIAMNGRLSTGERMRGWNVNVDTSCALCQEPMETMKHMFFECYYSAQIWETLVKGVMRDEYTWDWERLIRLLSGGSDWNRVKLFIMRYVFQSTVDTIWRERNLRRHGESPSPSTAIG